MFCKESWGPELPAGGCGYLARKGTVLGECLTMYNFKHILAFWHVRFFGWLV